MSMTQVVFNNIDLVLCALSFSSHYATRFPPRVSHSYRNTQAQVQATRCHARKNTDTDYEQLEYRLRTCGELCSGLFTSAYATADGSLGDIIKARQFPSIDSSDADRKRVLLGHIISTKSSSRVVTDKAMNYPKDWQTKYQLTPSTGHNEDGETVCIHSLCVHPDFVGKGLGKILLKSYCQRIKDSGVAKRIALICREKLIGYYEKAGFSKVGPSKCQYGGGNWVDMIMDFEAGMGDDDPEMY
jgi:ribosomal protein S18 acetylase RimI-like enzyme